MNNTSHTTNTNGGCVTAILTILTLSALWFGLPTPWGILNIDIFPPAIRLDNAPTP
jgi:hypothetical protein